MRNLKVLFEDENWVRENIKIFAYKFYDLHINVKFNLEEIILYDYKYLNNHRIFKYKDELFKITTEDFDNLMSTPSLIILLIKFNKIDYEFTDDEYVGIAKYFNNDIKYLDRITMDINKHINLFCELNFEDYNSLYSSKEALIKYIKRYLLRGIDRNECPTFYLSDVLKPYLSEKDTDILTIKRLKEEILSDFSLYNKSIRSRLYNKKDYIQNRINKLLV